jgi:hypothetical protein
MEKEEKTFDELFEEFEKIAMAVVPNFAINANNEGAYRKLVLYFSKNPQFEQEILPGTNEKGSLDKAIYLAGDTGSGKSLILGRVMKIFTGLFQTNSYQIHKYAKIMRDYESKGSEILDLFGPKVTSFGGIQRQETIEAYIDDFLFTGSEINRFGNKIYLADQFIDLRYDAFVQYGKKTHFSSNKYPDEFLSYLDQRSISRLSEMCNFIELTGDDWRRK